MGYVDRVAVKVWPDTREFDREMRVTTEKRRKTVIQAVLDDAAARAELKKLESTRTVKDLELRTEKARAKLADFKRQLLTDQTRTVEITADIREARTRIAQLRADLTGVSDKTAKIAIRADIKDATDRITRLRADLAKVRDHKIEIQADTAKARKELDRLEKDRKVVVQAQVDSLNARRELIMLARKRVAEIWVRVIKTTAMKDMAKVLKGLSGFNLLQKWRKEFVELFENLPQTVIRIALVGAAIASLALPLTSMMSALAPIGHSLNRIGPIVLAAVPLFGALAAQVTVLGMAFYQLRKSTSPAAKDFIGVLDRVKEGFGKIRASVQQAFFKADFTRAFSDLNDKLLPKLKVGLTEVARQVGRTGAAIMDAFGQALGDGRLTAFFDNLTKAIRLGIPGVTDFTHALTNIGTTGSEIFPDMARWINDIGKRFRKWTVRTDIEAILRGAAEQTGLLWKAMKNLGSVIAGVFRAMDTGKTTGLESFAETLGKVREIVWSPRFQEAMRTIFTGAALGAAALSAALGPIGDALETMAPLLSELFSTFGGIAADGLTGILNALSTPVAQRGIQDALQGIADMVKNVPWTDLGAAIGEIGTAIGLMAPLISTMLQELAPVLPDLIRAIADLIPPLTDLLRAILPGLVIIIRDVLTPAIEGLDGVLTNVTPWLDWKNAAWEAYKALWALRTVLDMLRANFPLVGAAVSAALGVISGAIMLFSGQFKINFTGVILAGVAQVLRLFNSLPAGIRSALGNAAGILVAAGRAIMQGFWNGMTAVWARMATWITGLAGWIATHKGPLTYDYALLQPAGKAIMAGLRDSMRAGMRDVESMVSDFAPRLAITVDEPRGKTASAPGGANPGVVLQVTNWFPQAEPTARTNNRVLQDAAALGVISE